MEDGNGEVERSRDERYKKRGRGLRSDRGREGCMQRLREGGMEAGWMDGWMDGFKIDGWRDG